MMGNALEAARMGHEPGRHQVLFLISASGKNKHWPANSEGQKSVANVDTLHARAATG